MSDEKQELRAQKGKLRKLGKTENNYKLKNGEANNANETQAVG